MKERIINNIDNYIMSSRILETLNAYLITNEGVLEEDHIENLKEQIKVTEQYKKRTYWNIFNDIKQLEKNSLQWK